MSSLYVYSVSILYCIICVLTNHIESSNSNEWPLRYHKSPWLEKSFLVREELPVISVQDKIKCEETLTLSDYGRSSFSSCQAEGECAFYPSPSCRQEIENRKLTRDSNITIDDVLKHQYVNPPARILPNKDGRHRETPKTFEQCHYLTEELITDMCSTERQPNRRELIKRFRFRNCRRFSLENSLTSDLQHQIIDSNNCRNILTELLRLDDLVEELACEYESILQRYDCDAKWSVKWTCRDCRVSFSYSYCSQTIHSKLKFLAFF